MSLALCLAMLVIGVAANADNPDELLTAAEKGDPDAVERLIAEGADINGEDRFGNSALHLAAAEGHEEVVEVLLSNGADVNRKGLYKRTPLHVAAKGLLQNLIQTA